MISSDSMTPKSFTVPLLNGQDSEADLDQVTPLQKSFNVPHLNGQDSEADLDLVSPGIPRPTSLRMLLSRPSVHHYWRKFDNSFMRPVFGGRGFVPFVPGSPIERSFHDGDEKYSSEQPLP